MIELRRLVLIALGLLLGACVSTWSTKSPVTPTSYETSYEQIPRNVGRLRRLAVLPLTQKAPKVCRAGTQGETLVLPPSGLLQEMITFLQQNRGYEVQPLDAEVYREWISAPDNAAFLQEITQWSAQTDKNAPVGPLTRGLVDRIRERDKADALLVLHIEDYCNLADKAARTAMGVLTMGLNELFPDPNLLKIYPIYRASIIESTTATPAWRATEIYSWQGDEQNPWKPASYGIHGIPGLFESLEPAIPKVLTE